MDLRYGLNNVESDYYEDVGVVFQKNNRPSNLEHWHNCYEIEYVISGTLKEIINGHVYEVSSGDLCVITPNDYHKVDRDNNELLICNIMFNEGLINENLLSKLETKPIQTDVIAKLSPEERSIVDFFIGSIETELKNKKQDCELVVRYLINIILAIGIRSGMKNSGIIGDYYKIRKAIRFIKSNFEKPLGLKTVAEEVGFEPNYFSYQFSKNMGVSFKTFVNEVRLNYAARKLEESAMPITEIAFNSGFGSVATFNRQFMKRYGLTPSNYRVNNQIKNKRR